MADDDTSNSTGIPYFTRKAASRRTMSGDPSIGPTDHCPPSATPKQRVPGAHCITSSAVIELPVDPPPNLAIVPSPDPSLLGRILRFAGLPTVRSRPAIDAESSIGLPLPVYPAAHPTAGESQSPLGAKQASATDNHVPVWRSSRSPRHDNHCIRSRPRLGSKSISRSSRPGPVSALSSHHSRTMRHIPSGSHGAHSLPAIECLPTKNDAPLPSDRLGKANKGNEITISDAYSVDFSLNESRVDLSITPSESFENERVPATDGDKKPQDCRISAYSMDNSNRRVGDLDISDALDPSALQDTSVTHAQAYPLRASSFLSACTCPAYLPPHPTHHQSSLYICSPIVDQPIRSLHRPGFVRTTSECSQSTSVSRLEDECEEDKFQFDWVPTEPPPLHITGARNKVPLMAPLIGVDQCEAVKRMYWDGEL